MLRPWLGRTVLRDNIQGITKPVIRQLACRGGVKRISGLIYEETFNHHIAGNSDRGALVVAERTGQAHRVGGGTKTVIKYISSK